MLMEPIVLLALLWSIFGFLSFAVEAAAKKCYPSLERTRALQLGGPISLVIVLRRAFDPDQRNR